MGLSFNLYSPDTGELLSDERYSGFEIFLDGDNHHLGVGCVIHQDIYLEHIDRWTIDESNELWKGYFSQPFMMADVTEHCTYFTREEIFEISKLMKCNNELLLEIMGKHNGIIVQIW